MISKFVKTSWYWLLSGFLLLIFFSVKGHPFSQVFYFITFLLPVIIGTSYFVNNTLIPYFLVRKKIGLFLLYTIYAIIISLYLQYLIIYLALYLFSIFQLEKQSIISMNIGNLSLTLYILVLIKVVIEIIQKLNQKETLIKSLKMKNNASFTKFDKHIIIRYNRINHSIDLSKIIYIESLSDYIKIVSEDDEKVTKEKISKIINRLPPYFKRTHRSFIINSKKISCYNREFVTLENHQIPISRTYKSDMMGFLEEM